VRDVDANTYCDARFIPGIAEFPVKRVIRSGADPGGRSAAYQEEGTGRVVRIGQAERAALASILITLPALKLDQI
jgi:hypothetical protein